MEHAAGGMSWVTLHATQSPSRQMVPAAAEPSTEGDSMDSDEIVVTAEPADRPRTGGTSSQEAEEAAAVVSWAPPPPPAARHSAIDSGTSSCRQSSGDGADDSWIGSSIAAGWGFAGNPGPGASVHQQHQLHQRHRPGSAAIAGRPTTAPQGAQRSPSAAYRPIKTSPKQPADWDGEWGKGSAKGAGIIRHSVCHGMGRIKRPRDGLRRVAHAGHEPALMV